MRYKPERDIPKAVRYLKTLSPTKIAEWIRENRTTLDARGKRIQVNVSSQSVNMWFTRFPERRQLYATLKAEIENDELSSVAISETLFQNGAFRKIPCIDKWIMKMRARGAKETSIGAFTGAIKQICLGKLPRKKGEREYHFIEGWGIKHPRRLTLEDCMKYNSEAIKRGLKIRNHRLAMRNFLKSRNIEGWDEISGKLESEAGQYAHLYIPKPKVYGIFDYLKPLNIEAYKASKFGFKTACRMGATLTAHAKFLNREDHTIRVTEKATRGKPKRIQEKLIPEDLWNELDLDHAKGKLFKIEASELNALLRTAYKEIIPELAEEIPMPFHFIARHQFAQHFLRATDWNYGLVARLGHWTVETLERYYGKMDRKTALESGRKYLPNI